MGKFYSTLGTDDNLVYIVMGCIAAAFILEIMDYSMKFVNWAFFNQEEE